MKIAVALLLSLLSPATATAAAETAANVAAADNSECDVRPDGLGPADVALSAVDGSDADKSGGLSLGEMVTVALPESYIPYVFL